MKKIIGLYILILAVAVFFSVNSYTSSRQDLIAEAYEQHLDRIDNIIYTLKVNSDVSFHNEILVPEVLEILSQIKYVDQPTLDRLRAQLYDHMEYAYQNLVEIAEVRQVQFHLPDGTSFLRMHRPGTYGDRLFDIRYSVMLANTLEEPVQGFEEGRIFNGYRFVYPIPYEGRHLGTVEISVSEGALLDSLHHIYGDSYYFMLSTEVIGEKVFEEEKGNYSESPFGEGFALDNGLNNEGFTADNPAVLEMLAADGLGEALAQIEPFSITRQLDGKETIINLIPVENVIGNSVAYIFVASPLPKLAVIRSRMVTVSLLSFLAVTLVFAVLFFIHRRKTWLEQQKRVLEHTVQERTKEIQFSLQKELYIKNVLETVFSVSEHLNVVDKIDSLLSDTCERITLHDFYNFAHVHTFDSKLNELLVSSAVKQDMDTAALDRFYKKLETSPQVQESLATGHILVENDLRSRPCAEYVESFLTDHHIKALVFVPLVSQSDRAPVFGYMVIFTSTTHDLEEERLLFQELGQTISKSILSLKRKEENEQLERERLESYREMLFAMADLIEKRDNYTAGHTRRVSEYAMKIGRAMGLDEQQLSDLNEASMLHDIGKIVTPDSVLLKPGRLTAKEYQLIKDHVIAGAEVLGEIGFFRSLRDIMVYHHEKYDGTGYPKGLTGDAIPLLSRIMAVADSFDAMTTNRIYKKRRTIENALEELTACSGTQFDPRVVGYAVSALKDVTEENSVSQLPVSGSDFERMAYHFKDNTTNLYNKSFLSVFIETEEWRSQICCGMHIALKGFDAYSISAGWETGRTLLAGFASRMEATYPDSFIFRIARSAFVILSREPQDFASFIEAQTAMLEEHGITLTAEAIDLDADGIRERL